MRRRRENNRNEEEEEEEGKQQDWEEEEEEGKNKIVEKGINKEKIEEGNVVQKKKDTLSLTILIDSALITEYFTLFAIIKGS